MKQIVFIAMIGMLLSPHIIRAEMFRYRDAGGVVRFTDNLADVPENQRAGMAVYEKTASPAAPSVLEQPTDAKSGIGQKSGDSAAVVPQPEVISYDPSQIDQLLKIKTALDKENAQFMKESLALSEEKKTLSGNDVIRAYNEKVSALNSRVDDYEKRRAAFQKEADAFDAAMKKRLAPPPQPPKPMSP